MPPSPKESAVLQVNQQFVQRIPPMALDRLQPDQSAGLVEASFVHSDKADERRYRFAMERMRRQGAQRVRSIAVGGLIALAGFGTVAYLVEAGSDVVAGIVATFLATTISIALGSKLLR